MKIFPAFHNDQFFILKPDPCPGTWITSPNQVIDLIDMIIPADTGFPFFQPAFIASLQDILRFRHIITGNNPVRGLKHRLHAHWKQIIIIQRPCRIYPVECGTAFWRLTGPSSIISVGLNTVTPVSRSPQTIAQLMALGSTIFRQ